jgi:hypothetical protein
MIEISAFPVKIDRVFADTRDATSEANEHTRD